MHQQTPANDAAPAAAKQDDAKQNGGKQKIFARIVNRQSGKSHSDYAAVSPQYLSPEQAEAWQQDGYFILRGLASQEQCESINAQSIAIVRDMAATSEANAQADTVVKFGAISIAEKNFSTAVIAAEDRASKLYNLHRREGFRQWSRNSQLVKCLGGLLGPDVDVFNSQFIFKNPGAWGQPWHQDSLYFDFDKSPQVGVWLATSKATINNGCLFVAPHSHREAIHQHLPDSRPEANVGYMEIRDYDFSKAHSVEMEVGDVLVFHSFLMHKSVDNLSQQRRTALVYHYTQAGTKTQGLIKSPTIDYMAVLRDHQPVDPNKTHLFRQYTNALKLRLLSTLLKWFTALKRKN